MLSLSPSKSIALCFSVRPGVSRAAANVTRRTLRLHPGQRVQAGLHGVGRVVLLRCVSVGLAP